MDKSVLLWAVLLFAFLPASIASQSTVSQAAEAVDAGVSRAYYRGARDLFKEGNIESAAQLLRTALEFQPLDSDILFLRASIAASRQQTAEQALEFVERAVSSNTWSDYSELEGRLLLSSLLLRFRRYDGARTVLESVPDTPTHADVLYFRAQAYRGNGDLSEARSAAERGTLLYPEDVRFRLVLLALDDAPGFRWGRWLRQHASDDEHILSALLYYAARQPIEAEQRDILALYRRYGGSDALSVVLDREAGGTQTIDAFAALGGFSDLYLIRRMYGVYSDPGSREILNERIAVLSGWISGDSDRDGFWEERGLYQDGVLRRWERDSDQNGIPEIIVLTDGIVPLEIVEQETGIVTPQGDGADSMRVYYSSYPEVSKVEFRRGATVTVYHIVPGRVGYPIVTIPAHSGTTLPHVLIPISLSPTLLRLEALSAYTYRRTTQNDEGIYQIESFYDGVLYLVEYDGSRDGRVDHLVEYDEGQPVIGIRDIDGDGAFELLEQYADGTISRLVMDGDLDGVPEYVTVLGDPPRSTWDFNEDGNIDAEEFLEGRERVLNLRSSGDERP